MEYNVNKHLQNEDIANTIDRSTFLFRVRKFLAHRIWKIHFPYIYTRFNYYNRTGKCLSYCHPKDFNQKLFWLNRYWQDPRIVTYTDKVLVREYIKECGYEHILTKIYDVTSVY